MWLIRVYLNNQNRLQNVIYEESQYFEECKDIFEFADSCSVLNGHHANIFYLSPKRKPVINAIQVTVIRQEGHRITSESRSSSRIPSI
jgi:hypothetical protein